MKRKYNLRKIKSKKSYSSSDLAELLAIHVQTVRGWNKEGLEAIYPEKHRALFLGTTVKSFLSQKLESKKVKLEPNQFYCLRCRKAVTPVKIKRKDRNVLIGKNKKSICLIANCPICECQLNRFSTESSYIKLKNKQKNSKTEKVIKSASPTPFNHSHSNK